MADNIFGNRFAERNGHAWWSNTTKRLEGLDGKATTALRTAGADYVVTKKPLFYNDEGTVAPTNYVALVRPQWGDAEPAILGVATSAYYPLQNIELAEMLDPLTDEWPTETVGALGKGETVFLTLNAGHAEVGGDEIQQYLFAYNSHDGSSAFKINITPVRVVCQNTCVTGLRQSTVTAAVHHTHRIRQEAEFAIGLVAQIRKAQDETIRGLQSLTRIHVSAEQVARIVALVYPERGAPNKLSALRAYEAGQAELSDEKIAELMGVKLNVERDNKRAIQMRLAVWQRLEAFNDERPAFANTAWAAYNAVTEVECWKDGGTDAQLAKSVLLGERAQKMAIAYRELSALSS